MIAIYKIKNSSKFHYTLERKPIYIMRSDSGIIEALETAQRIANQLQKQVVVTDNGKDVFINPKSK